MEPATMAILGSGLASAFGNVYSNTLNAANTAKINQKNLDLQAAINLDNIEAARLNNVTAVDLANTAHQREVRDLRDAGLNPILSATGGNGAATPSLQSPNLDAPTLDRVDVVNPLSQITSAVGQAMAFADQHRIDNAQAKILESEAPNSQDRFYLDQARHEEALSRMYRAQADSSAAQYDRDLNEARRIILDKGLYNEPLANVKTRKTYDVGANYMDLIERGMHEDFKQPASYMRSFDREFFGPINSAVRGLNSLRRR